ncbi:MAG: DUF3047 domain-containing protein, partial [Pseudomonadota bacterium]
MLNLGRVWFLGLLLSLGLPALAGIDEALLADGWSETLFDGKAANRYETDGAGGVTVLSESSVSLVQRPLDVDLAATPLLTWRWRVDEAAPPTDLGVKGGDDRSLAIYVAFPFQPEKAGIMERMKRAVVESVAGEEAPGRV